MADVELVVEKLGLESSLRVEFFKLYVEILNRDNNRINGRWDSLEIRLIFQGNGEYLRN